MQDPPNVLDYANYRTYLYDLYFYKKNNNAYFSYRVFSRCLGFKATNHSKLIVDGARNLLENKVEAVGKFAEMNQSQIDYFRLLIRWEKATEGDYKKSLKQKIQAFKINHKTDLLTTATVRLRQEDIPRIKKEIQKFLAQLIEDAASNPNIEKVYKIKLHLFPTTEKPSEKIIT